MIAALAVISVVLGVLRIAGVTSIFFQGVAHIFVGGLFGAYFAGRKREYLWLALGMTVVEVICFLAMRVLPMTGKA